MIGTLVPIKTSGHLPPLFCVHGEPLRIARRLHANRPVYALNYVYAELSMDDIPDDVGKLAAGYLEEIKSVQPDGPYYLFGFSAGAIIACEIAAQIIARGDSVANLCIADPSIFLRKSATFSQEILADMRHHGLSKQNVVALGRILWIILRRRPGAIVNRIRTVWHRATGTAMPPRLRWLNYLLHILPAVSRYKVQAVDCPLDVVCGDLGVELNEAHENFWRTLGGESMQFHLVGSAGTHLDLMQDPALTSLTQILDERVRASI